MPISKYESKSCDAAFIITSEARGISKSESWNLLVSIDSEFSIPVNIAVKISNKIKRIMGFVAAEFAGSINYDYESLAPNIANIVKDANMIKDEMLNIESLIQDAASRANIESTLKSAAASSMLDGKPITAEIDGRKYYIVIIPDTDNSAGADDRESVTADAEENENKGR